MNQIERPHFITPKESLPTLCLRLNDIIASCILFLSMGIVNLQADTFVATSAASDGAGPLQQAILDANALAGSDTIEFSIGSIQNTTGTLALIQFRLCKLRGPYFSPYFCVASNVQVRLNANQDLLVFRPNRLNDTYWSMPPSP